MKPCLLGNSKSDFKTSMDYHLRCSLCKKSSTKEGHDLFHSKALPLRDRMMGKILQTGRRYHREKPETSVAMDIKKSGGENIEGILCK